MLQSKLKLWLKNLIWSVQVIVTMIYLEKATAQCRCTKMMPLCRVLCIVGVSS